MYARPAGAARAGQVGRTHNLCVLVKTSGNDPTKRSTVTYDHLKRNVDYFCPNVRMGMATAASLEAGGFLRSAHVDMCVPPGTRAEVLERMAGPRARNRVVRDIPMDRICRHPQLALISRARWVLMMAGRDTASMDRLLVKTYRSIAMKCLSDAVVGTQSTSLELFADRKHRIMEQISHPRLHERAVAAEELARFPDWAPDFIARITQWDGRMEREWAEADQIWVPASGLIDASRRYGADPRKFRIIPYPIAGRVQVVASREFTKRRPLRVIYAGTLMLRKGVQYIYQALHKRHLPIQMHFFGQNQLTPFGLSRLAEIGTVHGHVPRSQLLGEFRTADALLFPSLSEGSALVTLEATGLGVPVIATEETGAPASAMIIPSRDPEAIVEALELLVDDRTLLGKLSEAGLAEAAKRDYAAYTACITESLSNLTAPLRKRQQ